MKRCVVPIKRKWIDENYVEGKADLVKLHSNRTKEGYFPIPNPVKPGANQVQVDTRHIVGVRFYPARRVLVGPMYVIDPKTKKEKLDQKGCRIKVEDRPWKDRPENWKFMWNDGSSQVVTEEDVIEQLNCVTNLCFAQYWVR